MGTVEAEVEGCMSHRLEFSQQIGYKISHVPGALLKLSLSDCAGYNDGRTFEDLATEREYYLDRIFGDVQVWQCDGRGIPDDQPVFLVRVKRTCGPDVADTYDHVYCDTYADVMALMDRWHRS